MTQSDSGSDAPGRGARVAGLLLAAGAGTRFGGPKALARFAGALLVEHGIALLRGAGADPVHVVLGAEAERVRATAELAGAEPILNPEWATGLGSSLRAGLAALPAEVDAVLITLVDQPLVGVPALARLRRAYAAGATIVAASYDGVARNPLLLERSRWNDVAEYARGDAGARGFLRAHPAEVTPVPCDDVGSPADIDTPDDLDALARAAESTGLAGGEESAASSPVDGPGGAGSGAAAGAGGRTASQAGAGRLAGMSPAASRMLTLGTPAPGFTLPDTSGTRHALDELAGEYGTVVAFLCNHCPYVARIGPALGEAAERWQAAGIALVGVNSNAGTHPEDAPGKMDAYARDWGWRFPYLIDEEQSAALAYRAACTPDFFLFDSSRLLAYRGRFDAASPGNDQPVTGAELDAAVAALRAGEAPGSDQWPSMGCGIKWRPGNEPT